jgi:exodeoxyribonuclease-3
MPDSGTFKLATYNANSIRARMGLILDWLGRESPDVLCVQETKVQDEDFPAGPIREAGYHVVFRGQKARAGVAIISRNEPQAVAYGIDDGEEPDEARLIRAVIGGVSIVNTYVPQGRDAESEHFQYKLRWFERLRAFFERHYAPDNLLAWTGDLNVALEPIDVYDPKGLEGHVCYRPEVREALQQVGGWGFVDVFRRHHPGEAGLYTYYDYRARNPVERGVGWRVDHIWATQPLAEKSMAAWIDVDARRAERPSDHTFLVAEFGL